MTKMNVPGPKGQAIVSRDRATISPSYPRAADFAMSHGRGTEVWDVDGNRFLDFVSGIAVCSTGHSHPKVVQAIQEQAAKFLHISSDYFHPLMSDIGERLSDIAPFDEPAVSFLTNSGTESVEAAIKLARNHTGRSQFIGFLGAFHGRTMGSVSFTASKSLYHKGFYPLMGGVTHVPYPDSYRQLLASHPGEDYGETVVRYIEEQVFGRLHDPSEVAGILVEPIQGEGGYVVPADGFFPALREVCDRHGILLIADEVQSGVGRSGKWWAIEHFGVQPDIVCSAKGIASGVPFGAMIARKSVVTWPVGAHGNTYGGNPLACAAALATLDLIEGEYMQNAAEVGQYMLDAFEEIQMRHPSIGQVRGKGLMIGVDLVKDPVTRAPHKKLRDRVEETTFEHGMLMMGCGPSTLRVAPPLTLSQSEADEGLMIFEEALTAAEREFAA
jgi:4-aminobutyrate aminotransferase